MTSYVAVTVAVAGGLTEVGDTLTVGVVEPGGPPAPAGGDNSIVAAATTRISPVRVPIDLLDTCRFSGVRGATSTQ